jgi:hypothetical protein
LFQDNDERKKILWEKYRDKLINHKIKRAQDILNKYFPDYAQTKPVLENSLSLGQVHLTDLIKDIVRGLPEWSIHEGDRDELSEQLGSMLEVIEKKDRLSAKWKMAKAIMPDTLREDAKIKVERLDQLILSTLGTITLYEQDKPTVETRLPEIQDKPVSFPEKPKGRTRHPSRPSRQQKILRCLDLHECSLIDAQHELTNKRVKQIVPG